MFINKKISWFISFLFFSNTTLLHSFNNEQIPGLALFGGVILATKIAQSKKSTIDAEGIIIPIIPKTSQTDSITQTNPDYRFQPIFNSHGPTPTSITANQRTPSPMMRSEINSIPNVETSLVQISQAKNIKRRAQTDDEPLLLEYTKEWHNQKKTTTSKLFRQDISTPTDQTYPKKNYPEETKSLPTNNITHQEEPEYITINAQELANELIAEKINEAKTRIEKDLVVINQEEDFENRCIALHALSTKIQMAEMHNDSMENNMQSYISDQYSEQAKALVQQLLTPLIKENGKKQYQYEWIIHKTRTTEDSTWTPQEKVMLYKTKEIYDRLQSNQGESWNDILSGYDKLNTPAQEILTSAIKQGLKYPNILEKVAEYIENKK